MASISELSPTLPDDKKRTVDQLLEIKEPPVARFRLLSRGMEAYHRLYIVGEEDLTGDRACLACGNCLDSCPVLRREPDRLSVTDRRTSFALESIVAEDCELCFSCILSCPQVDTEIKDYIVDEKIPETIPQNPLLRRLDNYFMVIAALVFGIILGIFIAR
ncbi:MAG: 4Fe-4S dicluster domain-containing protein [Candidatus Lernaella stagnicola]|nr:4Fe-4S dicluster domain-containing protein [Candidatus Lernaella stagnicola]